MWPRNSSCLHRCFPDISSSAYYCTFSELSHSSFHCLLSYLSIIWEHCIVTIRPMLIHSLPSFFILPSLTAFPTMQENVCWYEEILSACYILHFFIAGSGQKVICLLLAIQKRCRQEKEVSFPVGESDQRSGLGCSAPGTSEVLSYLPPVIIPKSKHWALLKIWFIQSIWWRDRGKCDSFYKK